MTKARQIAIEYLKLSKLYGPAMAYGNTTIDEVITALESELAQVVEPVNAELLKALDETNALLVAMLHELRPNAEVLEQIRLNRAAIDRATGATP